MNLFEKIKEDAKKAVKEKSPEEREILRYLFSLLQTEQARLGDKFNDKMAQAILQAEMKRKKEALQMFEKGGRQDLVDQQKKDIEILKNYLPKMMSEEEVKRIVKEVISRQEEVNFGKTMGKVIEKVNGRADGKTIAQLVREMVNQ